MNPDDDYLAHTHTLTIGGDVPLLHQYKPNLIDEHQREYGQLQVQHPVQPPVHKYDEQEKTAQPLQAQQPPPPGEIRISTMTATCHTNLKVDLSLICGHVSLVSMEDEKKEGILKTILVKTFPIF